VLPFDRLRGRRRDSSAREMPLEPCEVMGRRAGTSPDRVREGPQGGRRRLRCPQHARVFITVTDHSPTKSGRGTAIAGPPVRTPASGIWRDTGRHGRRRCARWACRATRSTKIAEGSAGTSSTSSRRPATSRLVINTPRPALRRAPTDGYEIRRAGDPRAGDPVPSRRLSGGNPQRRAAPIRRRHARGQAEVLSLQELATGQRNPCDVGAPRALHRRSRPRDLRALRSVIDVQDPDGRPPEPGQFYMLAAVDRWGGGDDGAPVSCRARSACCGCDDGAAVVPVRRTSALGTNRLMELDQGMSCG